MNSQARTLCCVGLAAMLLSGWALPAEDKSFLEEGEWLTADQAEKQNDEQRRIKEVYKQQQRNEAKHRKAIDDAIDKQLKPDTQRTSEWQTKVEAGRAATQRAGEAALRAAQADSIRRAAESSDSPQARQAAENAKRAVIKNLNIERELEAAAGPIKAELQANVDGPLTLEETHFKLRGIGITLGETPTMEHARRILAAHEQLLQIEDQDFNRHTEPQDGLSPSEFITTLNNDTLRAKQEIDRLYDGGKTKGRQAALVTRDDGLVSFRDSFGIDRKAVSDLVAVYAQREKSRRRRALEPELKQLAKRRTGETDDQYMARLEKLLQEARSSSGSEKLWRSEFFTKAVANEASASAERDLRRARELAKRMQTRPKPPARKPVTPSVVGTWKITTGHSAGQTWTFEPGGRFTYPGFSGNWQQTGNRVDADLSYSTPSIAFTCTYQITIQGTRANVVWNSVASRGTVSPSSGSFDLRKQ